MEGPLSLDCPPLFSPSLPFIQYLCYCPVFTFHFPLCLALSLLFLFHSPLHLVSRYLSHPLPPPPPLRCRMSLVGSSFKLKRRGPCLWGGGGPYTFNSTQTRRRVQSYMTAMDKTTRLQMALSLGVLLSPSGTVSTLRKGRCYHLSPRYCTWRGGLFLSTSHC